MVGDTERTGLLDAVSQSSLNVALPPPKPDGDRPGQGALLITVAPRMLSPLFSPTPSPPLSQLPLTCPAHQRCNGRPGPAGRIDAVPTGGYVAEAH